MAVHADATDAGVAPGSPANRYSLNEEYGE
jgi:hypothetical protein